MYRHIILLLLFVITINGYGQSILDKGKNLIDAADYQSARDFFEERLDSCNTACPDSIVGYLHVYMGKSLHLQNKYDTALIHYRNGINIFNELEDINGQVFSYTSLAEFYRSITHAERGIPYLEMIDSLIKYKRPTLRNLAYFYNRYAALTNESVGNRKEKVLSLSKKVLSIAREIDDKDLEANSLNEIGFVYEKSDQRQSLQYYDQALKIYRGLGSIRYVVGTLSNLSRASYEFDEFDLSLNYALEGARLCEENGWAKDKAGFYWMQYQNYKRIEKYERSLDALESFHEIYSIQREKEWKESIYEVETKFNISEKEKQLAEVRNAETIARLENERKNKQVITLFVTGVLLLAILGILYWVYHKTRRSNELLNKNVEEKEILMQEVHHRVKNNLTFLKSLLYLRAKASDDDRVKIILDECQSRVQSMALVHQSLYDVEDASMIDFQEFLNELFSDVSSMFDNYHVRLKIEAKCMLSMQLSIFLGLIVNELLTNSFKYAYVGEKRGELSIAFTENHNCYTLSYDDNGKGLPPDFDIFSSNGFGFKLIRILLDQIDATMSLHGDPATHFKIEIPK
ncbi:sensor histidine kinase [Ekhidna sp.]|uniref:sensor histidine kinase n=1 Tax=Ekhidna sp. TaxID=2608089 RepID=UPI003C7E817C